MPFRKAVQPPEQRSFSVEEVGEVIRTASALERTEPGAPLEVRERLSFTELLEVARELGIGRNALERAIPESEKRRKRAERRAKRKMRFYRHLTTWGVSMGGLAVVDFAAGPGWWVVYPAAIWGSLVSMHGLRVFLTGRHGALERAVYRKELEAEGGP